MKIKHTTRKDVGSSFDGLPWKPEGGNEIYIPDKRQVAKSNNIIKLHHLIGYRKILILLYKLNSPDYQTKMDQITNY